LAVVNLELRTTSRTLAMRAALQAIGAEA